MISPDLVAKEWPRAKNPLGPGLTAFAVSSQPQPFTTFTTLKLRAMVTVAKDTALTATWQQVKSFPVPFRAGAGSQERL